MSQFILARQLAAGALVLGGVVSAHAGEVVVVAQCPATGPGVAKCAAAAVVIHEGVQLANGKAPGPNGEIAKTLRGARDLVGGVLSGGDPRFGPAPSRTETRSR